MGFANLSECLLNCAKYIFVQGNLGHQVSEVVTVQGEEIQGDC